MRRRAHERSRFRVDELLQHPLQLLPNRVGQITRLKRGEKLGQVMIGEGHQVISLLPRRRGEDLLDDGMQRHGRT